MKILSLVLCAIYGFTVGIVTSFFDMGWFHIENESFNPAGMALNLMLVTIGCLLITFICISLDKED